ncbi:ABC transporter permease [Pseudodonghicola flavimaris]|uniref:ABC transporter permease n=1 Tax=Pseudodonghicola flavimaris TaxID=3050036 RepID=A0ABT7EWW7_9RHOB|nr:ABC transporter permease [Pseudodonghicola flavimaris]MDK3016836.1 ABC transporter permease [Pseudodonghicola flavimaris]
MTETAPATATPGTPTDPGTGSIAGPSVAYQNWIDRQSRNRRQVQVGRALILIAFLALWEVAPRAGLVNPMLTSYPSAVWEGFLELLAQGNLGLHIGVTLLEVMISFAVAMILGTVVAICLWLSPMLEKILDPFLVVGNALPKIALVPIFYIWLGPQGSIYAVAIAVALFITILMLYTGFSQTDPNKIKLARTLGAGKRQILTKVVLPGNVHTFMATLKANVGLSLVGVIVGEFQASKAGLGYLIVYGSQIFRMDMVMAAIVILSLMSVAIYLAVQKAETWLIR